MTADGRVLVTLKSEWHDGTTHLLFAPVELLEKLAALTPRPRINLVMYHGVLAPHARWRERVVSEQFGLSKVAHFREVGFKFDRWVDVGYWQRTF